MKACPALFTVLIAATIAVTQVNFANAQRVRYNLPPANMMLEPGPGVGGPGPGVLQPASYGGFPGHHGGGYPGQGAPATLPTPQISNSQQTVQILFIQPDGMQIRWDITAVGRFDSQPLIVPGRNNFPQNGIFRLKITNIEGREGVELYPTLEVAPVTPRTEAYLAHNAVPIQFTQEDFDQVLTGNFVTKVIYLPDPEFQEQALAGIDTLVSTRLDPGVDPIVEADRRGAILAVVRFGNQDIELPGVTPDTAVMAARYQGPAAVNQSWASPPPSAYQISPSGLTPSHVSGVSMPQYGMPMTGTPFGLPGPPHIPLGGPAGLQKHVMRNHTRVNIPRPTRKFTIDVRQQPGYSYPRPANHMHIKEQNIYPSLPFGIPNFMNKSHKIQ